MTAKLVYKQGFGPLRRTSIASRRPIVPRRLDEDALASLEFLFRRTWTRVCRLHRARAGSGRGRLDPMPPEFVQTLRRICDEHGILYVDDEVQAGCGRTGRCGRSRSSTSSRTCSSRGSRSAAGSARCGTGRAELMDAVHVGGLGGTFGGNPVACAAALAVLDELTAPASASGPSTWAAPARRLEEIAARQPLVGEVRGLGPMLALELRDRRPTREATTGPRSRGAAPALVRPGRQRHPPPRHRSPRPTRSSSAGSTCWRRHWRRSAGAPDTGRSSGLRPSAWRHPPVYGDVVAVDGVDLDIAAGEFFTARPLGLGQDDELRVIAGFERPTPAASS